MFDFLKKKEKTEIKKEFIAVANGSVVNITTLNDPVFSQKILGDGFAILPKDGICVAPISGKIINVADSFHAYGIETPDGLQVLVHIGIDTVSLNGKGFECKVKDGQEVKAGDILAKADLDVLKANNLRTEIVVLITNIDEISEIKVNYLDSVTKGETVVMTYEL